MLWLINSCFSAGGIGIVVVAILVIAITQYLKPARNKSSFHPKSKSVNKQKTFAKDDIPGDGHHMNKLLKDDYSERHLDEIAKCAMCLDEFSHNQMQEAGDGKMKKKVWETKFMASKDFQGSDVDGGNSYKSSVDAADKNCELSVGVPGFEAHTDTSADSKVLKQENDDVEIPDLLPDDISIDEEDEDNEEISPQAMADIEAEMLDSSILTSGSLEDDDETDVPKADEITEREDIAVQDPPVSNNTPRTVPTELCTESVMGEEQKVGEVEGSLKVEDNRLGAGDSLDHEGLRDDGGAREISPRCRSVVASLKESLEGPREAEKAEEREGGGDELAKCEKNAQQVERDNTEMTEEREEVDFAEMGNEAEKESLVVKEENDVEMNLSDAQDPGLLQQNSDTNVQRGVNMKAFEGGIALIASCLVRKAAREACKEVSDELATDQRSSQLPISGSEIKEQRVQETQLNEIMQLMKQHPDLFGDMTKKEMSDQMSMYCVQ